MSDPPWELTLVGPVIVVIIKLPWWLRWYRTCPQCERPGFDPRIGKISWRREWQPTPVCLPGEVHGQRSLEGYRPGGCKELDTPEQITLPLFCFPRLYQALPRPSNGFHVLFHTHTPRGPCAVFSPLSSSAGQHWSRLTGTSLRPWTREGWRRTLVQLLPS